MFKPLNSVMIGAFIAAAFTVLSAPSPKVDARSASTTTPAVSSCERPWPYLDCLGTASGDRRIRVVTTGSVAQ